MTTWILNHQELVALAIFLVLFAGREIFNRIKWRQVETAIKAVTPDDWESPVLRITQVVFDNIKQANADITDDDVRKRGAKLAESLINLLVNRTLSVGNIGDLMLLLDNPSTIVGILQGDEQSQDRQLRLLSERLSSELKTIKVDKAA